MTRRAETAQAAADTSMACRRLDGTPRQTRCTDDFTDVHPMPAPTTKPAGRDAAMMGPWALALAADRPVVAAPVNLLPEG